MFSVTSVMTNSAKPWTIAFQVSLSMGFPRQENWSGLPFPFQGTLPEPGIEPVSPALAGGFFTTEDHAWVTTRLFSTLVKTCLSWNW